jgi:hypothetical protein
VTSSRSISVHTRRDFLRGSLVLAGSLPLGAKHAEELGALAVAGSPYRAFRRSYWNREVPPTVRRASRSGEIIAFIKARSSHNYVRLGGTSRTGDFGLPIYWARAGDPIYDVVGGSLPPEFNHLRIPKGAKADVSTDGSMCVFDRGRGWVAWLFRATFYAGRWHADGGSIHRLASNGLDGAWRACPNHDRRNRGHRGLPGAVAAIRYDEVMDGVIPHAVRIAVPRASRRSVFPMVSSDGEAGAAAAPPEGARLRIKPSVDLDRLRRLGKLSRSGLVIARCLQRYGAVVSDEGGDTTVKVEHTVAEGRGWLWKGKLTAESLRAIPLDTFEVVRLGWGHC